jgi:hypothetical protein
MKRRWKNMLLAYQRGCFIDEYQDLLHDKNIRKLALLGIHLLGQVLLPGFQPGVELTQLL